ncbi:MAG: hypothetical protein GY835_08090 [bacterium]|nr:hypothetical protein [bacterium]
MNDERGTGLGYGQIMSFLRRRWLLLLIPPLLAAGLSMLRASRETPVFQSEIEILAKEGDMQSPLTDWYSLRLDLELQLETFEKVAESPELLQRLHLDVTGDSASIANLEELEDAVEVEVLPGNMVRLAYKDRDPLVARDRTSALGRLFVEELNRPRKEAAEQIERFLASELDRSRGNLDGAHLALNSYRTSHGKVLPELEAISYNLLLSLEAKQVEMESRLHAMENEKVILEKDPAVRGRTVGGLREQIERTRADLAAAERRMTERHPELQTLRARLDRLRLDLASREAGLTPVDAKGEPAAAAEKYRMLLVEIETMREQLRRVEERVVELQAKIAAAGGHDAEYVRRLRDVESHTEIYLDLVRRHERARTTLHMVSVHQGDLVRIVRAPKLSALPVSPRPLFAALLGLTIGLVLGIGLAVLAELGDTRITSASELTEILGAPTLLELEKLP